MGRCWCVFVLARMCMCAASMQPVRESAAARLAEPDPLGRLSVVMLVAVVVVVVVVVGGGV